MNKLRLLCLVTSLFLLNSQFLQAGQVKKSTTEKVALNWYRHYAPQAKKDAVITKSIPYKYNSRECFYIFSFDKGGFVIVSANDAATPVPGYGFDKAIPDVITNEAVKGWLDMYASQIDSAFILNLEPQLTDGLSAYEMILNNQFTETNATVVTPLLTTEWDQGWPYNALCPDGSATGCVPTAMAQIMKYHNWPPQGVGSFSYDWGNYGPVPGNSFSANFGETFYDFPSMHDVCTTVDSNVARLMFHCGVACGALFSYSTAVGYQGGQDPMTRAFVNYFRYAYSSIQYQQSDSYSATGWDSLLMVELAANRPVYYRGDGNGSHAFVCDGIDATGKYHFNFGWGGQANGYFSLSLIDPLYFNFTNHQHAVIGIKPNDGSTFVADTILSGFLEFNTNTAIVDGITVSAEPGTIVKFGPNSRLQVFGRLFLEGTPSNMIRITASDTVAGWQGINWDNRWMNRMVMSNNDSSQLKYTRVEYSKASGISCYCYGRIVVDHAIFNNNSADYGGGINIDENPFNIKNSEFYNNHAMWVGGGVLFGVSINDSVVICNNYFHDNAGDGEGGGLAVSGGTKRILVKNNTFFHNTSYYGGGVAILGDAVFESNIISNNYGYKFNIDPYHSPSGGAGIHVEFGTPRITNNLFVNNSSGVGSAMMITNRQNTDEFIIANNTIAYNTTIRGSVSGGAIIISEGGRYGTGSYPNPTFINNIIYNNINSVWGVLDTTQFMMNVGNQPILINNDIQGGRNSIGYFWGNGTYDTTRYMNNFDADPLFENPADTIGFTGNAQNADWGLQDASPCVNTGLPAVILPETDFLGHPRIYGGRVDLGAIENQNMVAPSAVILFPEQLSWITPLNVPDTMTAKLYVINSPGFHVDSLAGLGSPYSAFIDAELKLSVIQNAAVSGFFKDTLNIYTSNGLYRLRVSGEAGYCGTVNGVWQDSVRVICNITVPAGDSLRVLPGTKVSFVEGTSLTINGRITATGTSSDSIFFQPVDPAKTWLGMAFADGISPDSSLFRFCRIQGCSGAGISCVNYPRLAVDKSVIRLNTMGFSINNGSNIKVTSSRIEQNYDHYSGGGFYVYGSSPQITGNIIQYNTAASGAGLQIIASSGTLENNFINNNRTTGGVGGGIAMIMPSSDLTCINNVIVNNSAHDGQGGGILISEGAPILCNNTIAFNTSDVNGGGISFYAANPLVTNSILYGNVSPQGNQIFFTNGIPGFKNCDIEGGIQNILNGNASNDNPAFDYTGIDENNIDANPDFSEEPGGAGYYFSGFAANWRLNQGSPCINHGTPDITGLGIPALDVYEGVRVKQDTIDMGASEFDPDAFRTITGFCNYFNLAGTPLDSLWVILEKDSTPVDSSFTATNGSYSLDHVFNGQYNAKFRTTRPWAGVNSTDALKIQRHFAALELLTEPVSLQAADVNNSGSINGTDALKVKRRFTGMDSGFDRGDWTFAKPVTGGDSVTINGSDVAQNFYGLCVGDVNGSNIPSGLKNSATLYFAYQGLVKVRPGEEFEIPLTISQALRLSAVSLVLNFPAAQLTIQDVVFAGDNPVFNITGGELRFAWSNIAPLVVGQGDTLLLLKLKTTTQFPPGGEIRITLGPESELADEFTNVIDGVTLFLPVIGYLPANGIAENISSFMRLNVFPNPVKQTINLEIALSVEDDIKVELLSVYGQILKTWEFEIPGNEKCIRKLDVSDCSPGICFLRVRSGNRGMPGEKTLKIVISKN